MRKKYIIIFLIVSLCFLCSCNLNKDKSKLKFDEVEKILQLSFGEEGTYSIITEDIILPTTLNSVSLKWTSDKPGHLSIDGKINRGKEDVEVTLSVELKYKGKTRNITYKVTVKGKEYYSITFVDEDGNVLDAQLLGYGEVPTYRGETPTKASTAEYSYTFIGWSPEIKAVDGDQVYVALFEENIREYTVTFVDEDGNVLDTQLLEYGEVPTYRGETPTKASTAEYCYIFIGWTPEIKAVAGDQVYIAVFEKRLIGYPDYYVLAIDSDFEGYKDGEFVYIGNADYVIIPEYIKGVKVTKTSNNSPIQSLLSKRKDIKGIAFEAPENITDMSYLFFDHQLDKIDLSFIDTSNVTNMSHMFSYSRVKQLDLSKFDTSKVSDMRYMFSFSEAIVIDLSSFDTSNVTDMRGMFSGSQATKLDLSNFDTSSVTDMRGMFAFSQVTELNLSNFDTSNVTDMKSMFSYSNVTELNLSNFDTSNVTDMKSMFSYSKITELDLSNFDTSNVTDMSYMFYNSLATVLDLSSFYTTKVTNMSYMFAYSQATVVNLSNFDTFNVKYMNHMFYNSQATTLDLSSFNTSNVINMSYMFCNSYATVIDVSSFDTSNVTDMSFMFYNAQVTLIDLSNFNTLNVTDMRGMFAFSQVTELDLSSFDTSNVTNMNWMFQNTQATKGYARTQSDADRFNNSSGKPSSLVFIVKE